MERERGVGGEGKREREREGGREGGREGRSKDIDSASGTCCLKLLENEWLERRFCMQSYTFV